MPFRKTGSTHEQKSHGVRKLPQPAMNWGMLSKIFNQDVRNLPYVQQGMKATARNNLQLASYSETKLRHFHELLEKWTTRP